MFRSFNVHLTFQFVMYLCNIQEIIYKLTTIVKGNKRCYDGTSAKGLGKFVPYIEGLSD